MLLKKGAIAGLTLADIGKILCRPDEDDEIPSILEKTETNNKTIIQTIGAIIKTRSLDKIKNIGQHH